MVNTIGFLNEVKEKFKKFDISDVEVLEDAKTLILPIDIDEENEVPSYKLAATFVDDDYLMIYACFKHDMHLKKEVNALNNALNDFNRESFLTFTKELEFVKVTYHMPEIEASDAEKVVRIMTIIPSLISEFYPDLKPFLK